MGVSIPMAGRAVLAAAAMAGLACLGMAVPATASSRTAPGIGSVSLARVGAGVARQVAGRPVVPGFVPGIVPSAWAGLAGISCPAASFCVAAGSYTDPLSVGATVAHPHTHSLAEEWNGRAWRVMPGVRGGGLAGVSCASTRFCMAAGSPIEQWDGRRWAAVRTPRGLSLRSISCPRASFCTAVGLNSNFSDRSTRCMVGAVWRGTAWRAMTVPFGNCGQVGDEGLVEVSCASASACIAVGYQNFERYIAALAFWWNGKRWRELDVPGGPANVLYGLCPSKSFCMVVDDGNRALAWNGITWRKLSPPPGSIGALSCTSVDRCTGIGGDQSMTWNGTAWTAQAIITRPENSSLSAISCWRPSACMAAGSYAMIALPDTQSDSLTVLGARLTLAEQWNGSTWRVRRTPTPGDEQEGLSGISCPSAANCMAVGGFINGSDRQAALAERWNGRAWQVLATPDPGPNENVLTAVSCPAARQCMSVGYYDAAGDPQALAEQWNGSTWTALPVPHNGVLTGISCPAVSDCVAVGTYSQPGMYPQTLSMTWDGQTWTVQASPSPGGAGRFTDFNAVACPSPARCIAVGDYLKPDDGQQLPLTALWNGTTWTTLTTPAPGGDYSSLTAVSCSRPSSCMAVGITTNASYGLSLPVHALAESWDGTRWTVRPTPKLKANLRVHLDAVSCAAPARCRATGGYLTPPANGFVLAEAWNGATWRRLVPITDPSPAFSDLYAISCPAARHCIAVGATGIQRTLAYLWNGTRWQPLHTPNP
jgi:hypothetical protein